jgi:predicted DNA-binding transcriptional regulator AlpA
MKPIEPATTEPDLEFMTANEFARMLRIDPRTLRRRLRAKQVPAPIQIGTQLLFRLSSIRHWVETKERHATILARRNRSSQAVPKP